MGAARCPRLTILMTCASLVVGKVLVGVGLLSAIVGRAVKLPPSMLLTASIPRIVKFFVAGWPPIAGKGSLAVLYALKVPVIVVFHIPPPAWLGLWLGTWSEWGMLSFSVIINVTHALSKCPLEIGPAAILKRRVLPSSCGYIHVFGGISIIHNAVQISRVKNWIVAGSSIG